MTELLALSAVLLAVALQLYYITLTATKKPAPGQASREELVAEIERLNEALLNVSVKLQARDELVEAMTTNRFDSLAKAEQILEVARTTLGYVQLTTDRGLNSDAPFGEKLPEWFDENEKNQVSYYDGWELIRKDLEAVLPMVGG